MMILNFEEEEQQLQRPIFQIQIVFMMPGVNSHYQIISSANQTATSVALATTIGLKCILYMFAVVQLNLKRIGVIIGNSIVQFICEKISKCNNIHRQCCE